MAALHPEVTENWSPEYSFRPFSIKTTVLEFSYGRRSNPSGPQLKPSNISTVWTPQIEETLIGGVLQGRKRSDPKAGSSICRKNMWKAAHDVAQALGDIWIANIMQADTYGEMKQRIAPASRWKVKQDIITHALCGWVPNSSDDEFGLDTSPTTATPSTQNAADQAK
jgi:tRNA-specific adenosine deaminase 1